MEETSEVQGELFRMRVVVRIRPFSSRETAVLSKNVIEMADKTLTITDEDGNKSHQFIFDSCHWSHDGFIINKEGVTVPDGTDSRYSDQEAVFKDVGLRATEAAWQGYNAAVLAYGMTGSGKTYTMLGRDNDPGLMLLCCRHLFSEMESNPQNKYKVTFSLLEVYNEMVVDLLSKTSDSLQIRENHQSGPFVKDLTVMTVKSAGQMKELLQQGLINRSVAATRMNSTSSRSHLMVTIHFLQFITGNSGTRTKRRSRIRFVDMAGSEQVRKSGASGDTLREGHMINLSISGFAAVISALAAKDQGKKVFVPYRNTKLTRLLSVELGGNCVTTLIGAISPASINYSETLTALRLVSRARMISQSVKANDLDVDITIQAWKAAIADMECQLSSAASEEEKTKLEDSIGAHRLSIRQLEAPWVEVDTKEKSGIWWSTSVKLQQPELDTTPYIQNISDDAVLSGVSKYVIPEGHILVGKSDSDQVKIQLSGLGIQPWHAIFVNTVSSLSIAPCSSRATVHINGRPIRTPTEIGHLDHIKLGACELFIVIGFPDHRTAENASAARHTHEKCLMELAENHPLGHKLKPRADGTARERTAALMLFQEFIDLLPQVAQAHSLAESFGKDMDFEVEARPNEKTGEKLFIRVSDRKLGMEWVWTKRKFEDRKLLMDQLQEQLLSTGRALDLSLNNNPFSDADVPDTCLGRRFVSLHNIAHHMPVDDQIYVTDIDGKKVATLHVSITPSTSQEEPLQGRISDFKDPKELIGTPLYLKCALTHFSDVLWVACNTQRGIYCKVWLEGEKEVLSTETVTGLISGQFQNTFEFAFEEVTQTELNFLQTQGLHLEVWGTQTSSLSSPSMKPQSPTQASSSPVKQPQSPTQASSSPVKQPELPTQASSSPVKQPTQNAQKDPASTAQQPLQNSQQGAQGSNITSVGAGGLMLDLELAQDLRQFFRDICPLQQKLQSLKKQADENSQAQEVRLQSWADCRTRLQILETQLNQCVVSLKESVKTAIQRSKQT